MKLLHCILILIFCVTSIACSSSPSHTFRQEFKQIEIPGVLATDMLQNDLETVSRVLQILEYMTEDLVEDESVSTSTLYDIIEVINNFTDKCHQKKFEDVLFPFLKAVRGSEKKDFLGQLLMDHVIARDKIRELYTSVPEIYSGKKGRKKVARITKSYIKFMERHMKTEEKVLFPWINKVLAYDEHQALVEKLKKMDKRNLQAGLHEKYAALIEKLEHQLGVYH